MATKQKALGRGLAALIPDIEETIFSDSEPLKTDNLVGYEMKPVLSLIPNKNQPRKDFNENSLNELADSIREKGLLQPILVRPAKDKLEIIAGERRWRAAKIAGIDQVPVIIRKIDDKNTLQIALIENIQREDLNPIEEAKAYLTLQNLYNITHEQISKKIGKQRVTVTNRLRLLKLPQEIQDLLLNNAISEGHARACLALTTYSEQRQVCDQIIKKSLSVRQTENLINNYLSDKKDSPSKKIKQDPNVQALIDKMCQKLGTKIDLRVSKKGKGKIIIDYYSLDDLDRILKFFKI
ncbi:MAG: ParB/RepB/Spo0J family partition protein [Pseudomonadota bacterium]